ncbi:MAG: hypothetical protein CEE42_07055 [Promethearchaeota archaeon Loki_b31]|nr:MAG: hypothetical protein CEE42_07055 [Candidatus Lokiarchaeota archaeon Loki_b31]
MTNEDYIPTLTKLVDSIRNKLQDPEHSELKSPLQIAVIRFKSIKNEIQFLLFNHDEGFSDKTFDVLGPYQASKRDVLNDLGADIYKGKLFQSLLDNSNVIKADLKILIRKNIPYLKKGRNNDVIKGGFVGKEYYYLIFLGNLFDSTQSAILEFFQQEEDEKRNSLLECMFRDRPGIFIQKKANIEELPDEIQDFIKQADLGRKTYRMPFLAGYIRPPIWIGAPPYFTDQEGFYTVPLSTYIKTVKHMEILGRRIILMNDGFLGISINTNFDGQFEDSELKETYKLIDLFLSLLLICNVDGYFEVFSTHEAEFFLTYYNLKTNLFRENFGFSRYSKKMFELRNEIPSRSQFQSVRTRIHPLHIELVLKHFKKFFKMDNMRHNLKLLIDSYTHLIRLEFDQSFIFSWVLIEQYLNHIWESYLDQKKLSKEKKKKYVGRDYTANMKINLLSLLGILGEDDTRELSRLRKFRNDFMHNARVIENIDAMKAFKLALRFVNKRIDDYYDKKFKEFLIQNKMITEKFGSKERQGR